MIQSIETTEISENTPKNKTPEKQKSLSTGQNLFSLMRMVF